MADDGHYWGLAPAWLTAVGYLKQEVDREAPHPDEALAHLCAVHAIQDQTKDVSFEKLDSSLG